MSSSHEMAGKKDCSGKLFNFSGGLTITMLMDRRKFHFSTKCIHLRTHLINKQRFQYYTTSHSISCETSVFSRGGLFRYLTRQYPPCVGNKTMWSVRFNLKPRMLIKVTFLFLGKTKLKRQDKHSSSN